MATQQDVQIIDSLYNAFSTGDIATVLGLIYPQIQWKEAESNSLADSNPYNGPDAIIEGVFAQLEANHDSFGFEDVKTDNMSNNMVLATLRYDAKVKTTGKACNAQAAHLWTLNEDGKKLLFNYM